MVFLCSYPSLGKDNAIQVAGRGADEICSKFTNVAYRDFVPDALQSMSEAKMIATLGGTRV